MSYSFNWDCTLPISNINDIVSINIDPQAKAYDEGDYLSLRGQVLIDGEYTTTNGNQESFKEYIPIDITLPNNGRGEQIKPDITNFDYQVQDGSNLFLTLNLNLDGYDLDHSITLVEEQENEVEVQTQAPVLFTKEAVVAPVEHANQIEVPQEQKPYEEKEVAQMNQNDEVTDYVDYSQGNLSDNVSNQEIEVDDLDYIDFDEVVLDHVQEAIDPKLATERKESLTDKVKQIMQKAPVKADETVVEAVSELPKEVEVVETVQSESSVSKPTVEEVVEKVKVNPVIPMTKASNVVKPQETLVIKEEEEVLPFPIKEKEVVQEASAPTQKSDIFDMLYSLDEEEECEEETNSQPMTEEVLTAPMVEKNQSAQVSEKKEDMMQSTEANEEAIITEQNQIVSSDSYDDSIAAQFLDGESILKIVFVQEEETTISTICTKYNVPEKAIYNLEELNHSLQCGDRVMINYGKLR